MDRRMFLMTGAAAAVSGCVSAATVISPNEAAFNWVLSDPESAGVSRAGLEAVRAAVQKQVDDKVVNGAVTAIIRKNRLVWYEAQGYRDPVAQIPMRTDDIFRIMSSTKPVTAVAVLMMLDEGRLSLDDKVSRFIPSFANPRVAVAPPGATEASQVTLVAASRDLTIRDLLTHTSGLTSAGDRIAPGVAALVNTIERRPDDILADYVPRLGGAVLDFQPGSKWAYSPTDGMDTLLRIVEIVSGQAADVFLRERLFEPLDMRDTYFNVPADKAERVVDIWGFVEGRWQVRPHLFGEGPYRHFSGGGGLFATVKDRLMVDLMLLNGGALNGRRILRPETVELMTTNQVGSLFEQWIPPITKGYGFGLGVRVATSADNVNHRSVGGFGWGGAYGTDSWAEPERELAAAMFTQMQPLSFVAGTAFETAVHQSLT